MPPHLSDHPHDPARRRLLAGVAAGAALPGALHAAAPGPALPDWIDDLERRTFDFFWETTPHASGLTPDRWPSPSNCSIASVGFALTAYPIGVERGWITREQARERVLNTLRFFHDAPQGPAARGTAGHRGFYYHFLDPRTGLRAGDTELSTVDTALLMMGVLFCRQWFNDDSDAEARVRRQAEDLYARVDWRWAARGQPGIAYAWHPGRGHARDSWRGLDESMFMVLLAMGSPSHALGPEAWAFWSRSIDTRFGGYGSPWGPPHLQFGPLFGHQYTQVWVDLRGVADATARRHALDWFENSRRATLAQQAYAIANPRGWTGYGADIWGLTACDGPAYVTLPHGGRPTRFAGYDARGPSNGPVTGPWNDDGTIAPTAAASSIAFAPEVVLPALQALRDRYGEHLLGRYGFFDAFNPSFQYDVKLVGGRVVPGVGWFDTDVIGIDQGPILAMFANHRREAVWAPMRRADWLRRALLAGGFRGGWLG